MNSSGLLYGDCNLNLDFVILKEAETFFEYEVHCIPSPGDSINFLYARLDFASACDSGHWEPLDFRIRGRKRRRIRKRESRSADSAGYCYILHSYSS